MHELGHKAGLPHPWEEKGRVYTYPSDMTQSKRYSDMSDGLRNLIKTNLMNSLENPIDRLKEETGTNLTPGQMNLMESTIQKSHMLESKRQQFILDKKINQMKMIKKILYYFGILICSVAICSTAYSQNAAIHKNYKKISWKKITNEKKSAKHLKNMTDQYKYVYIRTLEQNDSFKILVTNKFSPLNEIKGGYNDFKYLEEHMMTPLFNYAVSVNYYEYKFVYILLNGRKEKLKFKLRKNRNFVYIIEYEDGWHLTYSNNSWW